MYLYIPLPESGHRRDAQRAPWVSLAANTMSSAR